jgi:hypothetical protein
LLAALWVTGSVLTYVVAAYVLAYLDGGTGAVPAWWRRWRESLSLVAVRWIFKLAYFVGVPYAAVITGVADFPEYLGLGSLNWQANIGRGALAGAAVLLGMVSIAWYSLQGLASARFEIQRPPARGWPLIFDALCLEAHWAFYRVPGILLTGDFLLGTFIGAVLAILEQVADPAWRTRAASSRSSLEAWQRLSLLVGMSAVFYFTRNLVVVWAVHLAVEWGRRTTTAGLLQRLAPVRASRRRARAESPARLGSDPTDVGEGHTEPASE